MKYKYELMCLSRECDYATIRVYNGIQEAANDIGNYEECCNCGEEFEIAEDNIFVRNISNVEVSEIGIIDKFDKFVACCKSNVENKKVQNVIWYELRRKYDSIDKCYRPTKRWFKSYCPICDEKLIHTFKCTEYFNFGVDVSVEHHILLDCPECAYQYAKLSHGFW